MWFNRLSVITLQTCFTCVYVFNDVICRKKFKYKNLVNFSKTARLYIYTWCFGNYDYVQNISSNCINYNLHIYVNHVCKILPLNLLGHTHKNHNLAKHLVYTIIDKLSLSCSFLKWRSGKASLKRHHLKSTWKCWIPLCLYYLMKY